jgi:hypothetical protein
MCLSRIIEQYDPPLGEKKAWGIFGGTPKYLTLPCFGWPHDNGKQPPLPCGRWLGAVKMTVNCLSPYVSGFHKYVTRREARKSEFHFKHIFPVKLRGIRILGEQRGLRVWVADEMLIPRSRPKKRK